ncbi:unannotated protein [freshwater metagenome]|uniref:Unannotated protein n=1 Tax=freshwater metagenome TaxID=449393 RepID=A0A6J6X4G3_9ZZZZ
MRAGTHSTAPTMRRNTANPRSWPLTTCVSVETTAYDVQATMARPTTNATTLTAWRNLSIGATYTHRQITAVAVGRESYWRSLGSPTAPRLGITPIMFVMVSCRFIAITGIRYL